MRFYQEHNMNRMIEKLAVIPSEVLEQLCLDVQDKLQLIKLNRSNLKRILSAQCRCHCKMEARFSKFKIESDQRIFQFFAT